MSNELIKEAKITRVSNAVAVGTADVTGTSIDMAGFEKVTFLALFGTITDGAPGLKAQQSSDDGAGDAFADLTGTLVTAAITDDNRIVALEITRPQERYLRPVVVRGGATGAVLDGIIAIQSGASLVPTTQPASVAASENHLGPGEGTA